MANSRILGIINKLSWFVGLRVILTMIALVCAATLTITQTTYQAEIGSVVQVIAGLTATDKGFTLASSASPVGAGVSCLAPVVFSPSAGTANTVIISGHLFYDVQVNSTTAAPASMKFNVTLVLGGSTFGPLCIQTPVAPQNGQTIDCKFDVGSTLPAAPYSFKVTVQ